MYVTPWMEVKIIMQGEISQSLRDKYCLGSPICAALRCQSQEVQKLFGMSQETGEGIRKESSVKSKLHLESKTVWCISALK